MGDIETVKAIAHSNPQLLKENVNGLNVLHIACQVGQEDVVSFLMGQGIDPNQPDTQGKTPLMYCCEVVSNPLCVRHLLQVGAKPNDCGKLNNRYPLQLAVEYNLNVVYDFFLISEFSYPTIIATTDYNFVLGDIHQADKSISSP